VSDEEYVKYQLLSDAVIVNNSDRRILEVVPAWNRRVISSTYISKPPS